MEASDQSMRCPSFLAMWSNKPFSSLAFWMALLCIYCTILRMQSMRRHSIESIRIEYFNRIHILDASTWGPTLEIEKLVEALFVRSGIRARTLLLSSSTVSLVTDKRALLSKYPAWFHHSSRSGYVKLMRSLREAVVISWVCDSRRIYKSQVYRARRIKCWWSEWRKQQRSLWWRYQQRTQGVCRFDIECDVGNCLYDIMYIRSVHYFLIYGSHQLLYQNHGRRARLKPGNLPHAVSNRMWRAPCGNPPSISILVPQSKLTAVVYTNVYSETWVVLTESRQNKAELSKLQTNLIQSPTFKSHVRHCVGPEVEIIGESSTKKSKKSDSRSTAKGAAKRTRYIFQKKMAVIVEVERHKKTQKVSRNKSIRHVAKTTGIPESTQFSSGSKTRSISEKEHRIPAQRTARQVTIAFGASIAITSKNYWLGKFGSNGSEDRRWSEDGWSWLAPNKFALCHSSVQWLIAVSFAWGILGFTGVSYYLGIISLCVKGQIESRRT